MLRSKAVLASSANAIANLKVDIFATDRLSLTEADLFYGRGLRCPTRKNQCRRKSIAKETTKMSQPENKWKNPSALSGSQYCTRSPVPKIRRLLAKTAIGTAARARTTRTQVRVSIKYP